MAYCSISDVLGLLRSSTPPLPPLRLSPQQNRHSPFSETLITRRAPQRPLGRPLGRRTERSLDASHGGRWRTPLGSQLLLVDNREVTRRCRPREAQPDVHTRRISLRAQEQVSNSLRQTPPPCQRSIGTHVSRFRRAPPRGSVEPSWGSLGGSATMP